MKTFLKSIIKSTVSFIELTSYALASNRLANLGYHNQAKTLMDEHLELKEKNNA